MARLYIVSPDCGSDIQFEADVLRSGGWRATASVANLTLPTLAACAPDDFSVELCDERIAPADLEHPAEHVWITCNSRQASRMRVLAAQYRRRGKTVAVGGPFATLSPEAVRPHCDILFRGELEPAADELFADLRSGRWKAEYIGPPEDLARSPLPRWDLYPNDRAWIGVVQASRGCPKDCSFCEVIRYYGRRVRRKPVDRVLAELDEVWRLGYREVFLSDDNLAAERGAAEELLEAIARWNGRRSGDAVRFYAQMTPADGRDGELLALAARAGLVHAYVGVEATDPAGLLEAGKRHNLGFDMDEALRAFFRHGIDVIASLIVGFDSDDAGVFGRHEDFIGRVPLPLAQIGPLVLTSGTPLHRRYQAEGRLRWGGTAAGLPWITNVLPKQMTQEQLLGGLVELYRRLYAPEAFARRLAGALALAGSREPAPQPASARPPNAHSAQADILALVARRLCDDPALAPVAALVRDAERRASAGAPWLHFQVFTYLQNRSLFSGS